MKRAALVRRCLYKHEIVDGSSPSTKTEAAAKVISSLARDLMSALLADREASPIEGDPKASLVETEASRLENSESRDADPQKKKSNDRTGLVLPPYSRSNAF